MTPGFSGRMGSSVSYLSPGYQGARIYRKYCVIDLISLDTWRGIMSLAMGENMIICTVRYQFTHSNALVV